MTLVPADGTERMTGLLTTTGESVFLGGRCQAEYTLFGPRVSFAARIREGWMMLFAVGGTDQMTGFLTTAGENGLIGGEDQMTGFFTTAGEKNGYIGDSSQTEYTLSGLGHRTKWMEQRTDLVCLSPLFFSWLTWSEEWNGKAEWLGFL